MSFPSSWRRLAVGAVIAALVATVGPLVGPAGAQADAQVVFIHAFANGPGVNSVAVCYVGPETVLVDPVVSGDTPESQLAPGDYTVSVYTTFNGDCESGLNTPDVELVSTFAADSSTALAVWPVQGTGEIQIGETPHDVTCVDPGTSRLMASNLANFANQPVDLEYDSSALDNLDNGDVGRIDVPTGTYDFEWVQSSDSSNFGVAPFALALPETTLTHVILAGGPGSVTPVYWTFDYDLPLEECVQPTTTTSTTTVAPLPVAPPTTVATVTAATPAFTG